MFSETAVNVGGIRFDRKDFLGSGFYGSVYRGNYKGQSIAVKRVENRTDRVQLVENELNILKKLDHPNIVKLLHFDSDADFQYFALEFCNTSLEQVFRNRDRSRKDKRPTLPNNFEVFFQLASGLKYIHSQKIIHRDIKPGNILISVKPTDLGEEITIKWADFGLSRAVNERGTFTMSGVKGTLRWFAPEVLEIDGENLRIEETRGNIQSDVFAEGLVFGYILLKGSHIYGQKEEEIVKNIRENRPINMNQIHQLHWARNLIEQMLTNIPENRITSEEVVAQLQSTRIKLIEEEKNLHRLCADMSTMSDFRKNIESLIQIGIDFNAKDKDGWNALHHLCLNSSSPHLIEAIRELIKLGIDKDAREKDGWNALHLLCSNSSSQHLIEAIQVLIKLGIDKDAKNNKGWNALHLLCSKSSSPHLIEAIQELIKLGIDKDAKTEKGWNALHLLCSHSSSPHLIEAIQELIKLGIDKDAKTKKGWNALHLLCVYSSSPHLVEAIQELIKLGIDKDAKAKFGFNALHLLCSYSSSPHLIEAIQQLIKLGIDKDAKAKFGVNALHLLCLKNSGPHLIEAIQELIKLGIDKDAKIFYVVGALDMCRRNNYLKNFNVDEIFKNV